MLQSVVTTNTDLRWLLGLASPHRCCLSSSSFCNICHKLFTEKTHRSREEGARKEKEGGEETAIWTVSAVWPETKRGRRCDGSYPNNYSPLVSLSSISLLSLRASTTPSQPSLIHFPSHLRLSIRIRLPLPSAVQSRSQYFTSTTPPSVVPSVPFPPASRLCFAFLLFPPSFLLLPRCLPFFPSVSLATFLSVRSLL